MANAPRYDEDQLEAYLIRISYSGKNSKPVDCQPVDLLQAIAYHPLEVLRHLQTRHLAAIPWGNSALHYSQHHTISLDPDTLFEKLVERRLDGYCMESTGLFLIVLRSLGYTVYPIGGRIGRAAATGVDDGTFSQLSHMALIVLIDGVKYMVDVGFGTNCATAPLPLLEGECATRIAPSEIRLIKDSLLESTDKSQKVWMYQIRHNRDSEWLSMISFSDVELLPQDFDLMNFAVSQRPTSWFTQRFVCTRMILDPTGEEIVGQYVLAGNDVKERRGGHTEVVQTIESETDRVKALAKYFDMNLRTSEIQGIRGMASEIK